MGPRVDTKLAKRQVVDDDAGLESEQMWDGINCILGPAHHYYDPLLLPLDHHHHHHVHPLLLLFVGGW